MGAERLSACTTSISRSGAESLGTRLLFIVSNVVSQDGDGREYPWGCRGRVTVDGAS